MYPKGVAFPEDGLCRCLHQPGKQWKLKKYKLLTLSGVKYI